MKNTLLIFPLASFLCFSACCRPGIENNHFYAFYTKLADDYPPLRQYQDSLFSKYADIIVNIDTTGQVIFSRTTSYMPVWKTKKGVFTFPEIVPRTGDGPAQRPDLISRYSHVRLIKNTPDEIIIHWRYFPKFGQVEWQDVVDEYFTFTADGSVKRTVRKGTERLADWEDQDHLYRSSLALSLEGIRKHSEGYPTVEKKPGTKKKNIVVKKRADPAVILYLSFDQELLPPDYQILETVSGQWLTVQGPEPLNRKGISGQAMQYDGYYSSVHLSDPFSSDDIGELSIEVWACLAAYPFDWAPFIEQAQWGRQGFYLGVDQDGHPGFHLATAGGWQTVADTTRLDLYRWVHLVATFNRRQGSVILYIDGEKRAEKKGITQPLIHAATEILVGLNREKMPVVEGRLRIGKWPSLFGIDGLIDELTIFKTTLTPQAVKMRYHRQKPEVNKLKNPDIERRCLPVNPMNRCADKFGAIYTHLFYHKGWDALWRVSDHPDILVFFDKLPVNLVFWRGTSYGPFFVTENGRWIGDQSNEDYRLIEYAGEAEGCLEHMSDKQCRHSHVRLIENNDARVRVHWRYGLVDSRYYFAPRNGGWGGWTDEYWTIYPDGIALRQVARGIVFGDGWVETMFLCAPDTKPEDNVDLAALTLVSPQGNSQALSWANESPQGTFNNACITMVNSLSRYRMFNIYPSGSSVEIFGGHSRYSKFHWWNHWPVSQITSDGRGARSTDRVAHSSLIWGAPAKNFLLYGITDKPAAELLELARSWNSPPALSDLTGCHSRGYHQEERAYHIEADAGNFSFMIKADSLSPLINPAFVIINWPDQNIDLNIDGPSVEQGSLFRFGFNYDTSGKKYMIVWLELQRKDPVRLTFSKTKAKRDI